MVIASTPYTGPAVGKVKMEDGYRILYAFSAAPDVAIWPLSGKPLGMDGGEPIDTSTFLNTDWHTFALRQLKTLTQGNFQAGYDPYIYSDDDLAGILNQNQAITQHMPDGSKLNFYGGVTNFDPGEMTEAGFPTASVRISPTNSHPTTHVETGPEYVAASGTWGD